MSEQIGKIQRMQFIEIIELLRETSSSNEKVEILKEAIETKEHFKAFLEATYNPLIQYHIRKIPEYRKNTSGHITLGKILCSDDLDILSKRLKTGGEAIKHLTALLESLFHRDAEALELLIKRSLDCGVSAGLVNKACKGLIKKYPVMLCSAWNEKLADEMEFPAYSQLKSDGLRGNLIIRGNSVESYSRNGKDLGVAPMFAEVMKKFKSWLLSRDFVLDGEFMVIDGKGGYLPRKKSNGIINKCAKGTATEAEMDLVRFVVWDMFAIESFDRGEGSVPYQTRFSGLEIMLKDNQTDLVTLVESKTVYSISDAREHFHRLVARGEEGTILKSMDGIWKNGRPKYQLKMKLENECDLIIKELVEGNGKYLGKLGAIACESSCGFVTVSVGSGLSDQQRTELWEQRESLIGKIVSVKYNEKITNSAGNVSLFLPIFVELREDKTEADSLSSIL